jgi:hypothetical protein
VRSLWFLGMFDGIAHLVHLFGRPRRRAVFIGRIVGVERLNSSSVNMSFPLNLLERREVLAVKGFQLGPQFVGVRIWFNTNEQTRQAG